MAPGVEESVQSHSCPGLLGIPGAGAIEYGVKGLVVQRFDFQQADRTTVDIDAPLVAVDVLNTVVEPGGDG
jgi:hypothetical protein